MAQNNKKIRSDEVVVSMEHVNKWFGQFHVLRDIILSVARGERIVVRTVWVGQIYLNRCLNLEQHQQGDIHVHGIELNNDVKNIDEIVAKWAWCFNISTCFRIYQYWKIVCLRQSGYAKHPGLRLKKLPCILTRVKIPEQAHKYPGQLSGGQQQRVAIALCVCSHS